MLALGQQRAASAAAAPMRPMTLMARTPLCLPTTTTITTTPPRLLRPRAAAQQQQKGFGGAPSAPDVAGSSPSSSGSSSSPSSSSKPAGKGGRDDDAALEALEARLKSRRQAAKNLEPRVKVESAAVKLGTGQAPGNAGGAAETLFVQFLGALFVLILVEGLVLAGSGFLPDAADAAVSEWLYPSYSPQILLFLGMSSLYGLFKTGKLPGQKQI